MARATRRVWCTRLAVDEEQVVQRQEHGLTWQRGRAEISTPSGESATGMQAQGMREEMGGMGGAQRRSVRRRGTVAQHMT